MFYPAAMHERSMSPQQPEPSVNATYFDGRWRLEARAGAHLCAATAYPPMLGVVARSAVRLGEYLAIVVDDWTPGDPPTPIFHSEWRDVAELIAEFEGQRPR
jgi:hypothetical protein